jgi:hypothetical protein
MMYDMSIFFFSGQGLVGYGYSVFSGLSKIDCVTLVIVAFQIVYCIRLSSLWFSSITAAWYDTARYLDILVGEVCYLIRNIHIANVFANLSLYPETLSSSNT